jgi:hypothetical protein
MLFQPLESALIGVTRRLSDAGIIHALGGSAMLRLCGYDVEVEDLDIIVTETDRAAVAAALPGLEVAAQPTTDPWRSTWLLKTEWDGVPIDIIAGLALLIEGHLTKLPFAVEQTVAVGEVAVPLAPRAHWYHLYRAYDPGRAALVASRLSDEDIMAAAAELGIDHLFSPTLIVRIGNV